MLSRFAIYQVICEHLEITGYPVDAVACFHQMCSELAEEMDREQAIWIRGERSCEQYRRHLRDHPPSDFKFRCCEKLEGLGDTAVKARRYDEAISRYTTALSLIPTALQNLLGKRSRACAGKGKWEDALNDANEVAHFNSFEFLFVNGFAQVIKLHSSSPLGYERKHEALRGLGYYDDAIETFKVMLLKMSESSDPQIRGEGNHVVLIFFC